MMEQSSLTATKENIYGGKYRGRIKHSNLKGIVDGEWLKG